MQIPRKLYRFRPLEDGLLDREISTLQNSYLYAPPFSAMNDPMEAFYETGGPGDGLVNAFLAPAGKTVDAMYEMVSEMIEKFALVSFAGTHEDLPMWAYYGSNFAGMCLEFDSSELVTSDFQGESLHPVTYVKTALPPMSIADLSGDIGKAITDRITRKRIEWAHEKEWRYIAGQVGPKHYLDDALRRVFLGPRVKPEHARQVCEVLAKRPVEVLQGEIRGYNLSFRTLQAASPFKNCERVGAGRFEMADFEYAHDDLKSLLKVPLDDLWEQCKKIAEHPNLEEIQQVDRSGEVSGAIYIWAVYKLRSERQVWRKIIYDRNLKRIK